MPSISIQHIQTEERFVRQSVSRFCWQCGQWCHFIMIHLNAVGKFRPAEEGGGMVL